jgi:hypothetical protein
VVIEDEGVLARQVGEQENVRLDVELFKAQVHGGGGAEGIAVGADVGGKEDVSARTQAIDDLLV